ncbi:MAG: hypothetical protein GXY55_14765 [Phycisphaerae bacterium]|nr:hypothetical protein [Phycisphaerae bacterium]
MRASLVGRCVAGGHSLSAVAEGATATSGEGVRRGEWMVSGFLDGLGRLA